MGSSSKDEQARVRSLLLDTVSLLCKNGLTYKKQMKIQGLLGITLDEDDVFIVHINDAVGDAAADAAKRTSERVNSRESNSSKTPEKSAARKRGATASPSARGPPDKKRDVIVIGEDEKRKHGDHKPMITNVRGGLPPNHPHTPQKHMGMRGPVMGSPNRMSMVVRSPNQRGVMLSPQRMAIRGRPPMQQTLRCQYCGGMFNSQYALIQHMREAHKSTLQGHNAIGQVRPVGTPMPGVNVKRNLYPGQAPHAARKNRLENNSNAPIAIDASPPPADTQNAIVTPATPNSTDSKSLQTGALENSVCADKPTTPSEVGEAEKTQQGQSGENTVADTAGSEKSDPTSQPPSNAGSRPGSRAGSTVAKSGSEGSDTEAYSTSPARGNKQTGRESVASGMSESEMANLPSPNTSQNSQAIQDKPRDNATPPPILQKEEPVTPANAINITPTENAKASAEASARPSEPNIFSQLQATLGDLSASQQPSSNDVKAPASNSNTSQVPSIDPQSRPPQLQPQGNPGPSQTFEIKPEGPFGSEILGGQQMFESQNLRPVVRRNQPGQFMPGAAPQGTTILTVAPPQEQPPIMPTMPTIPTMPTMPTMPQQMMPQMQNPFMQPQQHHHPGFPPHNVQNQPFGGPPPGFNGYY